MATTKEYYARTFPEFSTLGIDEQYRDLYNDLIHDIKYNLPNQPYVGNCTKVFAQRLIELYGEKEFERIQSIDFPSSREKGISDKQIENELKKLFSTDMPKKNTSVIVNRYHPSLNLAHRKGCKSPIDGWNEIKSDYKKFEKFYENRLRCSDWFKEKDNIKYLIQGYVPEFIYGIGLSTSRKYPQVSYFKPSLAKYVVGKWCSEFDTIFDPFAGYCGRMLGVVASGKNYIGVDLCESTIMEDRNIYENVYRPWAEKSNRPITNVILKSGDSIESVGSFDCLFTCPPYSDLEQWPDVDLVKKSCDEWIDICLTNYKCKRYVFVVDDTIEKYRDNIVETLDNVSHFGKNNEYIVVIDAE